MSRLVEAREDVGQTIARVVEVVAVIAGLLLAPLVAATPSWVPVVFGHRWSEVATVIPPASLHLMVFAPISVALVGYLWAVGEASAVLRASLAGTAMLAAALIPLLLAIGVPAVGFGWIAGGLGEATILVLAARKHTQFHLVPGLVPPTAAAVAAAACGWLVASRLGASLSGGCAGALVAAAVYLTALWCWHRSSLLDSFHLSVRGLRHALARSA
jgi:O-antigen/teichoic acid export membrane protein